VAPVHSTTQAFSESAEIMSRDQYIV